MGWISHGFGGKYLTFNTKVALDSSGAIQLGDLVVKPPIEHIVLGDFTKWASNLLYVPINTTYRGASAYLAIGGAETDVPCYSMSALHDMGYTLGQFHYTGIFNDFRDYEPYTTLQIYLPFYGFIDVAIADVMNEYIQFRLKVDFTTGQAVYYVGVNDTSVSAPNAPFYSGIDDTYTRIIGIYTFNIGTSIPLGQTGMADAIRNIALGVVRGAATVAGAYAVSAAGLASSTSTTKQVVTKRNPSTGRQIKDWTQTETTKHDFSNYRKGRAITSAIDVAADTLSNMSLKPSCDVPSNPFVADQGPTDVYIVRRKAIMPEADGNYKHLYGQPLGSSYQLDLVHGYTEVSNIHFEGAGFGTATNIEIAMIEDAFSEGVLLP